MIAFSQNSRPKRTIGTGGIFPVWMSVSVSKQLVERAEAAGEGDERLGPNEEVHLPRREVVEVDAEAGGDVGVRELLVREDDVEAEAPGADVEGATVRRFHHARPAAGDDDEVAAAVLLAGGGDDAPELARLVVVAGLGEDAPGDVHGAARALVAGSRRGRRLGLRRGAARPPAVSTTRVPPKTTMVPRIPASARIDSARSSSSWRRAPRSSSRESQARSSCARSVLGEARIFSRFARAAGSSGSGGVRRPLAHFTFVPEGTDGSTARSDGSPVPGSEAARTIPFDSIPISFAGRRFATTTTFRPTSCSAV